MNVELTTEEKLELGNLNAVRMIEIGKLEEQKKKQNDELNKQIKAIQEEVIIDSITLKNGYREQDPQMPLPLEEDTDEGDPFDAHWADAESPEREAPKPKKGRKKKASDVKNEELSEAALVPPPQPQHDPEEEDAEEPLPTAPETPPKSATTWLDRKVFMRAADGSPTWPELLVTGQIYDDAGARVVSVICTFSVNGEEFRKTIPIEKLTFDTPNTTIGGAPINKASKVKKNPPKISKKTAPKAKAKKKGKSK